MATRLGAAFLTSQGLDVQWVDARTVLKAETAPQCQHAFDAICRRPAPTNRISELQQRWSSPGTVWITQGFIASDDNGDTVLLGSRWLGYLRQLLRGEAAGAPPGNLDRRAGHVQRQSALGADRASAARAGIRRGAGNRQQRREGAASALHHAGEAVRHSAVRLRDADAEARRHGHHHARRQRRGAGQGGHDQEEHHADLDGDRRACGIRSASSPMRSRCSRTTALSVDLVSTSETSVTVSLDPAANTLDKATLDALIARSRQAVPRRR